MFTDYLINIAMAAGSYWAIAVAIMVISFLYVRKHSAMFHSTLKAVGAFVFFFGLVVGLFGSSNTYKNTVDYNPVQAQREIEKMREFEVTSGVVDRTLKPQTVEERAATSVDMRERVQLSTSDDQ